jgi:endonuclease YncB( thermonuclease family)
MILRYRYRRRDGWWGIALVLLSLALALAQQHGWLEQAADTAERNQPGLYKVVSFSDGDTIVVNMNGKPERVRFIGVDTPETHKPNAPVQCYGAAAAAFTKNLIGKQRVRMVSDSLSTNRDRYDRLLRYVYLPDGRLVNQLLIRNGYGFYYPYFPYTKSNQFKAEQIVAKAANRGLWGNCSPTPTDRGGYISNDL